jgi:hypothetical protein
LSTSFKILQVAVEHNNISVGPHFIFLWMINFP